MIRGRTLSRAAPRKRSRYVSRSRSVSRPPRQQRTPVYTTEGQFQRAVTSYGITRTVRTWDFGSLILGAGQQASDFAILFQLSYLQSSAELAALYSQYRVDRIVATFIPMHDKGMLYTAIDYQDGTVITRAAITERDSCHITPPGQTFTVSYQPRYNLDVEGTAYSPTRGFIRSTERNVNHHGLKVAVARSDNSTSQSAEYLYRVYAKVYLSLRNVT